ncbi:MAG TPA: DUF5990 family protein, partial [Acidobacteriaceae bacterium]|nr:DUF5990 family protein [Acidobacteriaceae bacterium]
IPFRLLRRDECPATNPLNLAYRFGLQDTHQEILPGGRHTTGMLFWDFSLTVKRGKGGEPLFTGRFASGPVTDRFVYLSWWAIERKHWINRVKARLCTVEWTLIQTAQEQGGRITADMTGWMPGDARKYVTWFLSESVRRD